MKNAGWFIVILGSLLSILFPPYTFGDVSGYGFIWSNIADVGFFVTYTNKVIGCINYQNLLFQLLAINTLGVALIIGGKTIDESKKQQQR